MPAFVRSHSESRLSRLSDKADLTARQVRGHDRYGVSVLPQQSAKPMRDGALQCQSEVRIETLRENLILPRFRDAAAGLDTAQDQHLVKASRRTHRMMATDLEL